VGKGRNIEKNLRILSVVFQNKEIKIDKLHNDTRWGLVRKITVTIERRNEIKMEKEVL
jgi:hypothetical protein